jgi:15-cis-phytoene desaturase
MLDRYSVAEYARQHGVSEEVVRRLLFTATQAVLFMAADQFSAYAFFAPAAESAKRGLSFRLGAFRGGMTETMINPLAKAIQDRGGDIRTGTRVSRLIIENERVLGVATDTEVIHANCVVLAASLHVAQELIRPAVGEHPWFQPMLRLETLSAATIQFELDEPVFDTDHTNFSPTSLCCFAEQSHTTFRHLPGRLSVILFPPEEFLSLSAAETAERVYRGAERLGIRLRQRVRRYRVANHPHDFYAMKPGSEALRPLQHTPIRGLALAGDYTKQPFVASMEGATISGKKAAEAVLLGLRQNR